MAHYRLYRLDPATDRIKRAEDFEAADDIGASLEAERRRQGDGLEIWSGARKVAHFAARVEGA